MTFKRSLIPCLVRCIGFGLLLLAPALGAAAGPADPRVALLDDWSHGDPTPSTVYRGLLGDKSDPAVKDRLLIQVASQEWVVIDATAIADIGDLLHDFDHQLSAYQHALTEDDHRRILAYAGPRGDLTRHDYIGRVYGPLAAIADHFGLRMLALRDGTGEARFAVVPPATYRRWLGVKLSKGLRVEDASLEFADELAGSPYARYLRGGSGK